MNYYMFIIYFFKITGVIVAIELKYRYFFFSI